MGRSTEVVSAQIAGLSALVATLMIAQQVAGKAVRDGFFLQHFSVTALPVATLCAALVSFGAALLIGRFIGLFSPAAAVPVLFGLNGLCFFGEFGLAAHAPRFVAGALYLHMAAFGGAVVSGFWSVINERFDPYTARQMMGRIAGGATLGGLLGGALTWAFSDVDPRWMMLGFALTSAACGIGVALVAGHGHTRGLARGDAELRGGLAVISENVYPRSLAQLVLLVAATSGIIDYVFKAGVVAAGKNESLVGFFGVFYTVTGVFTFLVQAFGSQRVLRWAGVVPAVALLPVLLLPLSVLALVAPGFVPLLVLRGAGMVLENSVYRSGYELLYTPLPKEQKRSAKVLIDLGCDRLGTALASGVVLVVLALAVRHIERALLLSCVLGLVSTVLVLVAVRRHYVDSLAAQLSLPGKLPPADDVARRLASTFVGEPELWGEPSDDSRPTSGSGAHISRSELLEQVRARAEAKRGEVVEDASSRRAIAEVSPRLLDTPLRARLRESLQVDAELIQSAPALVGQLGDVVLSERESMRVRLLGIELLAGVPSARCVAALWELRTAPEFRLRRAAALALMKLCEGSPQLRPPRREIVRLAEVELRRPSKTSSERTAFERHSPFRLDSRGNELAPTLELVFILLALIGDAGQLRLALSAVTSADATRRGTGLEFLDNLLPPNLRLRLIALAEQPELTQASHVVPRSVVEALAVELRGGELSVEALRAKYRAAKRKSYDRASDA
ncbi:MAG: hypothetical protein H6718_29035 [Polyangiaceae bacterium]|nr:hypothetical protein [Polyangiaceae bacterium]